MKVLIIEDEKPAAEQLKRHLKRFDPDIEIVDVLDSIDKSIDWFRESKNMANLVLMDIHLVDGLSFEIFNHVTVNQPVIFTTAYNEYAIQAFKVNSIDYILKPVTYDALYDSLIKLEKMRENLPSSKQRLEMEELSEVLSQLQNRFKTRFMVKVGDHIRSITTDKIIMFFAEDRFVYIFTNDNRKLIVDYRLEEIDEMLNPAEFFRANRSFIININSIKDVIVYSNSRLKIVLNIDFEKEIIVSRERVIQFKNWFNGLD
jgi:DNA-binding LytR/AlgR family response regulator